MAQVVSSGGYDAGHDDDVESPRPAQRHRNIGSGHLLSGQRHLRPGEFGQPAHGQRFERSSHPAGFTRATTSLQVYDNTSTSTGSTGRNGTYCETVFGVDFSYAGGAGSAVSLPDLRLVYDEA